MCGIAGFFHVDSARPADPEQLHRMTASLVHRGPDAAGSFVQGSVGLGMRRLAIIDVEGGDQPIGNEDGSIQVIQNGEIYNYVELRQELESLGHRFRTRSDTEVLVHGYETWGDELVQRLNGMWAFALWDEKRSRLLLSRDRLGVKPLHYTWNGKSLLFGSEIKALCAGGWPLETNWEVLDAYVAFGFVPEPHSLVRGVLKLPPGCNLVLERHGHPQLRRYWRPPIVDEADTRRDEGNIVEEFDALLTDAVRLQLRSDVPLGGFLSGGLDSGSIVVKAGEVLARESAESMRTFTVGFDDAAYDERDAARSVAQQVGTRHVERVLTFADLESSLQVLGRHFDEPFGDSSAIATYAVCGVAREVVTVGLSGDGGDEVLAGYTRYQGEKFSATWRALPGLVRSAMVPPCVDLARRLSHGHVRLRLDRVARVIEAANMSFEDRLTRKQAWSSATLRANLLRRDTSIRPAREFLEEALRDCPARDNFHRLNWLDLTLVLPSQMLTKVDRMSMAHSLEVRVPFLDHRLVELMAPVSAGVKLPGYRRKHVLRRSMARSLPQEVLSAPKRGFNVPVREWFRDEASFPLLSKHFAASGLDDYLERRSMQELLEAHRQGRDDHGAFLWILLQLATWCERSGKVPQRV